MNPGEESKAAGSAEQAPDTLGAVIMAGLANFGIAIAKALAGILSGSAAMLAEAAHSVADTITEVLLYVALRAGARPPTEQHPLGHGRAAFLWAFLASVATFVFGAGFAITHGVAEIASGDSPGDIGWSLGVLALSAVLEAAALRRSRRESRHRAARWQVSELGFLAATSDTALRAVVLEDVVALFGLAIAATGLVISAATGSDVWDGLASVLIGVLLLIAAFLLGRRNVSLLIGRSAPPMIQSAITQALTRVPGIDELRELFTEVTGPGEYLVLARVDFADHLTSSEVEEIAERADAEVRAEIPSVSGVFLHPAHKPD